MNQAQPCKAGTILNVVTGKCVKVDGKIGKSIIFEQERKRRLEQKYVPAPVLGSAVRKQEEDARRREQEREARVREEERGKRVKSQVRKQEEDARRREQEQEARVREGKNNFTKLRERLEEFRMLLRSDGDAFQEGLKALAPETPTVESLTDLFMWVIRADPENGAENCKRVYRRLSLWWHPDKGGNAEVFKTIGSLHRFISRRFEEGASGAGVMAELQHPGTRKASPQARQSPPPMQQSTILDAVMEGEFYYPAEVPYINKIQIAKDLVQCDGCGKTMQCGLHYNEHDFCLPCVIKHEESGTGVEKVDSRFCGDNNFSRIQIFEFLKTATKSRAGAPDRICDNCNRTISSTSIRSDSEDMDMCLRCVVSFWEWNDADWTFLQDSSTIKFSKLEPVLFIDALGKCRRIPFYAGVPLIQVKLIF